MQNMKYDVQDLLTKIYAEFSMSTTRNRELKEYFDKIVLAYSHMIKCCPTRWAGIYNSLEHMLKVWDPVKKYFIDKGETYCSPSIWRFIKEQKDEISTDVTLPELILYFVHSFLFEFQKRILIIEKAATDVTELHIILTGLRDVLTERKNEKFFGARAHFGLLKLPKNEQTKFEKIAIDVYERALWYLEKWYDFGNKFHLAALKFNLKKSVPNMTDCLEISKFFNLNQTDNEDELFSEVCSLKTILESMDKSVFEDKTNPQLWAFVLKKGEMPNL